MDMGKPRIIEEITDAHLKQIQTLAGYGLTMPQIANAIGIGRSTFYDYIKRDYRISEALEAGRALARVIIGEALFKQAKGGNIRAIQYYEATRFGVSVDNPLIQDEDESEIDYSLLDYSELMQLEQLIEKAKSRESLTAEYNEVDDEGAG